MKIIKEGFLPSKRFECENCGCVFTANEKEYKRILDERQPRGIVDRMELTRVLGYWCLCPYCGEEVDTHD